MKIFASLRINIDCIYNKLNLKSIIKYINIKTKSVIIKRYWKLTLRSVFLKNTIFSIISTLFSLKLVGIDSFVALIFNADTSFVIIS